MPELTLATEQPTATERAEVRALAERAEQADGHPALSEQFLLSLGDRQEPADAAVTHILARADGRVVGYAQARGGTSGEPTGAELVVEPQSRRGGIGSALLEALPRDARVWAHGVSAATEGFARATGLTVVRSLFVLGRSLTDGPDWSAPLPAAFVARAFEPERDEDEWVRVNALAFAGHPEQGSLKRPDLEQRMGQPWFRAADLLLVTPADEPGRVAAFHWTKVDPPGGALGEVYVVGIDPAFQGRGLARPVTALGLDHLRGLGCERVELYVDETNERAVRTYEGLGFRRREVHRQFVRR